MYDVIFLPIKQRFNLIDLLRAVDVERGSDAYSDSFDMDME